MSIAGVGLYVASFTGRNGSGAINVPGLRVGDRVLQSTVDFGIPSYQPPGSAFELIVSVNDEIQQKDASDFSAYPCVVVILRQS